MRIAALNQKLTDPGLYAKDPAAFANTTKALADAQAARDAAEERWLELEMLREELEA
jgi:ATP-binding cassette subfamily F protein uup